MAIHNCVRRLREEMGLTQEQLAFMVQVSRQTINAIETGRYNPSLILALKLAKVFGLPVEQIFFLDADD
jgi:putative transcriptional regulator